MLMCNCGRLMHTQGVEERTDGSPQPWLVRSECGECGLRVACVASQEEAAALVDRLIWTDDARHVLERMPPYLEPMVRREVEDYAGSKGQRVITFALLAQARNGGTVAWDPGAERRVGEVAAPGRGRGRAETGSTPRRKGPAGLTPAPLEGGEAGGF